MRRNILRLADKGAALVRRLRRDSDGGVAVFFAIALPVLIGIVGLALDYGKAVSYKQDLQIAADSAALTAANAVVLGNTAAQAQVIGANNFNGGAPNGAASAGTVTVSASVNNNLASATVSYSGPRPSPFSFAYTGSTTISVTATAQAAINKGSQKVATYAGRGSIWGDPHLDGVNGVGGYFTCDESGQTWYNALSDAGLEVNFNCAYTSYWNADYMQDVTVILGKHIVRLTAAPATTTQGPNGTVIDYNGQAWFGGVSIDGVYYPPKLGSTSYLNGQVTQKITDLTTPGQQDNSIVINTANGATTYNITIDYDEYQFASMTVSAVNAGQCGIPGGMFGQTLAGLADLASADFSVASDTSTAFQFNWAACASGTGSMSAVRLTK